MSKRVRAASWAQPLAVARPAPRQRVPPGRCDDRAPAGKPATTAAPPSTARVPDATAFVRDDRPARRPVRQNAAAEPDYAIPSIAESREAGCCARRGPVLGHVVVRPPPNGSTSAACARIPGATRRRHGHEVGHQHRDEADVGAEHRARGVASAKRMPPSPRGWAARPRSRRRDSRPGEMAPASRDRAIGMTDPINRPSGTLMKCARTRPRTLP